MLKKTLISLFASAAATLGVAAQSVLSLSESFIDDAVILPESFETDINKMMQNWYMQTYVVSDGIDSFTPDVPATDAEIIDRLSRIPAVIEMPYNSVVRSIINAYTQRRRPLVQNILGLSLYYMPIFEEALEREGLPLELRYLPVIESALNPDAVSRAGAAGLWQFMTRTAKGLGMEVNSVVDERRDPYKSSEMAAKYLKELYNTFGDWSLAIAAYNCGPGNVSKALRRAGEGKHDFWSIYPFLLPETRTYFPGFIAANYVMNYYNEHGLAPTLARRPIVTDSVHVKNRVYFQQIADVLQIPVAEIRVLNPQYRKDYIPGDIRPYPLVLPSFQIYSYIMSEDSILAHDAAKYSRRNVVEPNTSTSVSREEGDWIVTETITYHKVKKGETYAKIAKKYGVTVSAIQKANGKKKTLIAGKTIKIPITKRVRKPKQPEPEPEPIKEPAPDGSDVVLPSDDQVTDPAEPTDEPDDVTGESEGDNESEDLPDGEETDAGDADDEENIEDLKPEAPEPAKPEAPVPAKPETPVATPPEPVQAPVQQAPRTETAPPAKPKTPAAHYHTVRKGESVAKIAKKYGTTVNKILKLNNLKSNAKIYPGQKLRVK